MKSNFEVLNDVWVQFCILLLLLMLSVDSINPIKVISEYLAIPSYYWGFVVLGISLGWFSTNLADIIYLSMRVFLHSVMSISFKSIDIVGADNIPKDGPVIFTGNHANQFVDGMVVLMNSRRKVGFMIAEKSWHRPIIGHLSRIMGCIPVVRPQDSVVKGIGKIKMENATANATANGDDAKAPLVVVGEGTQFTSQVEPGDQIRLQGKTVRESGSAVRVDKVIDDTHVIVAKPVCDANGKPLFEFGTFGIYKRVDQSKTFEHVYAHLKRGDCIGIFPEGGSHDRTDLLPLKAGVAILALGVKDKYNINAAVVPVGLTYFRGHRFRGRVVIEFGTPLTVESDELALYHQDKRKACNAFLGRIEEGMRSVIVTTPDYNVMQLVYAARRLFQPAGVRLSAQETQDLNRRFAEAYKILSTTPEASKDLTELQKKVEEYNRTLRLMALKDHQVPFIAWWTVHDVIGAALYGALVFLMASLPTFVLNAPVGILARYVANAEQKRALEGSKVKIKGRDVVLSKKIMFCMVAIPSLWVFYFFVLLLVTDWKLSTIFLVILSFPLFSYFGIRSVEAGMIELKTIMPLFYRLMPRYRKLQDELPRRRAQLQVEVRQFVEKYKGYLGVLTEPQKIDWTAYMHAKTHGHPTPDVEESDKKEQKKDTPVAATTAAEHDEPKAASAQHLESVAEEGADNASTTKPALTRALSEDEDEPEEDGHITREHDLSFLQKTSPSAIDLQHLEEMAKAKLGAQ